MVGVINKGVTDYEIGVVLDRWLKGNSPSDGRELDKIFRSHSGLLASQMDS